jgi:hypothetical protein
MNIRAPETIDPARPAFYWVDRWPTGGRWPPVARSTTGIWVLTREAVDALTQAHLTGFKVIPLPELRPCRAMPPRFRLPDQLWVLTPTGRVRMVESELYETTVSPTGEFVPLIRRFVPEIDQPQAQDFALVANTKSHTMICTPKVVEVVRELKWKNLRFAALDLLDPLAHEIDPLAKKWPPQWYPDGVQPHPNNLLSPLTP